LPVKLLYFEKFDRVQEAFCREKQVQGWSSTKILALINKKHNQLHRLAECKNESHFKNFGGFDSAQPPKTDSAQPG